MGIIYIRLYVSRSVDQYAIVLRADDLWLYLSCLLDFRCHRILHVCGGAAHVRNGIIFWNLWRAPRQIVDSQDASAFPADCQLEDVSGFDASNNI